MRKCIIGSLVICAISAAMSITAFAGTWKSDSTGWWYDNGNGSYPANCWQWIDGNNDGNAESYYFNQYGYCLQNTTTPDGYTVNGDGAWVINGSIQYKQVGNTTTGTQQTAATDNKANAVDVLSLNPASGALHAFTNRKTSRDQLWGKGGRITIWETSSYVEYYVGKQYNYLEFEYAPDAGFGSSREAEIDVYGDDDNLLEQSDTITYKTGSSTMKVDISGQDYVKIYVELDGLAGFNGNSMLFKNIIVY